MEYREAKSVMLTYKASQFSLKNKHSQTLIITVKSWELFQETVEHPPFQPPEMGTQGILMSMASLV